MDRGTYAAASAGLFQMRKLEVQNNNLANLDTAGYKRELLTVDTQPFEDTFAAYMKGKDPFAAGDHARTPGVVNVKSATDFSVGSVKTTGNPLDVALRNPNDFFVINSPDGVTYTRAGNFTLSESGELVTPDGAQVSGDGGGITVSGPGATISENGSVRVRGEEIGKLQVVRIEDPQKLERAGSTRFKLGAGATQPQPVDPELISQSLEMSNVSAISSMVDLIVANRAFEAYTKAAQTIDQMNQSAITQVGRRT